MSKYKVSLVIRNAVEVEAPDEEAAFEKACDDLFDPFYWEPPFDDIIIEKIEE